MTFHKDPNTLSVIVPTKLNITVNLPSTTRQTSKLIHQGSRQNSANLALICLNVLTAKEITKLTLTHVHSRDITLIESSTLKNVKSSMRIGANQFVKL